MIRFKLSLRLVSAVIMVVVSVVTVTGIAFAYNPLAPDQPGWIIQTVDDMDDVGQYNSLALHPASGAPRISYYDATHGDLKYAVWDGAAWQVEVVDDAENVGQYSSLALDPVTGVIRDKVTQRGLGELTVENDSGSDGVVVLATMPWLPRH